jgi:hypothetical protein
VSKSSAAKKARRKKRLTTRNDRWLPPDVHADLTGVAELDEMLVGRGWEFDEEFSSDEFLSWFYPPSGIDVPSGTDDESIEPVTRVWLTDPAQPHVILVGTSEADGVDYQFAVGDLEDSLDEVEAFRAGDPLPEAYELASVSPSRRHPARPARGPRSSCARSCRSPGTRGRCPSAWTATVDRAGQAST